MLDRVPSDAQVYMIQDGDVASAAGVREKYKRLRPLEKLKVDKRGWTLDVLTFVRSLDKQEFHLADMYAFERPLLELHPKNFHIRDKIRQQLQVLRDLGLLEFTGGGSYRLR